MSQPNKLKFFNLFGDGESYFGRAEEITLPKLAMKGEGYRAGTMLGCGPGSPCASGAYAPGTTELPCRVVFLPVR